MVWSLLLLSGCSHTRNSINPSSPTVEEKVRIARAALISKEKPPEWMLLSMQSGDETNAERYDAAIRLIRESVRVAQISPDIDRSSLLCLHCKVAETLLKSGRTTEALQTAKETFKALNLRDWREQLIALRVLTVERECYAKTNEFDRARVVSEKMNQIDNELIGKDVFETVKRRVRVIEVDFAKKDFARVVSEGKSFESLKKVESEHDPNSYLMLAYLGMSQIAVGEAEEGRRRLQLAAKIKEDFDETPFPAWVDKTIDSLHNRTEVRTLLNRL